VLNFMPAYATGAAARSGSPLRLTRLHARKQSQAIAAAVPGEGRGLVESNRPAETKHLVEADRDAAAPGPSGRLPTCRQYANRSQCCTQASIGSNDTVPPNNFFF